MNEFNLIRLKRYGVLAEIVRMEGGSPILKINLPSRQIGFGGPPHQFKTDKFSAATAHINDADRQRFFENDPSCEVAAEVLDALARHGQKLAAAAKNASLSDTGKHSTAVEAATQALTTIGTQFAQLLSIGERLTREHAQLYAVPQEDAAAAAVDVEIRRDFKAMDTTAQLSVLAKIGTPESERLLLAFKRSPWPLNERDAKFVVEAWATRVAEAQPEKAASLSISQENHEWAHGLSKYIAGIVSNPSVSGAYGSINRFDCYRILRTTGGAAVLNFTREEISMFERRLAEAAAA